MKQKSWYSIAVVGIVFFLAGFFREEAGLQEEAGQTAEEQPVVVAEEIVPYESLFRELAPTIDWEWETLAALACVESRFAPFACSFLGAKGIMQLMDGTAHELGLNDTTVWIAEHNIRAGVEYIRYLQGKWSFISNRAEQTKFVLASYNAGPGHIFSARRIVRDTGGNPYVWVEVEPYVQQQETRQYVKKVLRTGSQYKNESLRRQSNSNGDTE